MVGTLGNSDDAKRAGYRRAKLGLSVSLEALCPNEIQTIFAEATYPKPQVSKSTRLIRNRGTQNGDNKRTALKLG